MWSEKEVKELLLKSDEYQFSIPKFILMLTNKPYVDIINYAFQDYKVIKTNEFKPIELYNNLPKKRDKNIPYTFSNIRETIIKIARELKGMPISLMAKGILFEDRFVSVECDGIDEYIFKENVKQIDYTPYIIWVENNDPRNFQYVIRTQNGIDSMDMSVKEVDVDIKLHYNDDLPYDQIRNFIDNKGTGICVLFGTPGTGKSYFLRHLIYESKTQFVYLDSSMFNNLTDPTFIQFLMRNKDSVFILEDCESLLQSTNVRSNQMSGLLNIADGLLADNLNIKFICTFNTKLKDIDSAILRKGRLHTKYEFTPLKVNKVQALAKHLNIEVPNKEMALCDIFNYNHDTGNKPTTSKIGF